MVSIIIPCYNSGKYLSECIDSILFQDYTDFEIIIVNDCSSDNTSQIATNYAKVDIRIKVTSTSDVQSMGASNARNKGFEISKGEYVVFLDSDDIWLPTSLKRLVNLIEEHNEVGWLIGNCIYFKDFRYNLDSYQYSKYDFEEGVYEKFELLPKFIRNFNQTPSQGAAIIKRDVIIKIKGWENEFKMTFTDQAFYSKILCETKTFVTYDYFLLYRNHEESSSMKSFRNGEFKKNEKIYFQWLIRNIQSYEFREKDEVSQYATKMIDEIDDWDVKTIAQVDFWGSLIHKAKKLPRKFKTLSSVLFKIAFRYIPKNIYRHFLHQGVKPYSQEYGTDRGKEIARYYVECFLEQNTKLLEGNCLEFQAPTYLLKYADPRKCKMNVIHLEDSNVLANIVGDLTQKNTIPSNYFDCIICTHVLHVVYKKEKFLSEINRILKPGGFLLLAVPGVSMCDYSWNELWRFTELGIQQMLEQKFDKDCIQVKGYGNSLVAAGQIRGLAKEEFSLKELKYYDGRFAVEICALAQKNIGIENSTVYQ